MQNPGQTDLAKNIKDAIRVLPKDRKIRRQVSREASCERFQNLIRRRDSGNKSFKRAPPSLWLGYTYQLHPVSGQLRMTVRLTGIIPESVQNKKSTSVHVGVRLHLQDSVKKSDICLVCKGKQLKASTIIFENVSQEELQDAEIRFSVYSKKGRIFKTSEPLISWTVDVNTEKILRSNCDWKNIKNLA